jgi:hypothetical protein
MVPGRLGLLPMRWCTLLLVGSACALGSCGPRSLPPPPPAPSLDRPQDAIPADLDVAVRLDLARMRDLLGLHTLQALRRRAPAGLIGSEPDEQLLGEALEQADTVWVALRPGLRPDLSDSVLVLEGRFRGFDPSRCQCQPRWQAPSDLGGAWRLFDRAKPAWRGAPARIYMRGTRLLVFASVAEIDSVERAVELRAGDPHVEPPSQGVVSVEARANALASLLAERAPAAARLLRRASTLRAHADVDSQGLRAELELEFEAQPPARDAARAMLLLQRAVAEQHTLAGAFCRALEVAAVGTTVVARAQLGPDQLGHLVGCAVGRVACTEAPTETAVQPGDGAP